MKKRQILIASLFMAISANIYAARINVDGDLSDWGVSRTGNASDWLPDSDIFYTVEDQNTWKLEPGYGGQNYDAEAMYAYKDQDKLFVALATGHNPETEQNPGKNSFGAGDFAIDFDRDGRFEIGINVKPQWDSFGILGGVYNVTDWAYGLWSDNASTGYKNAEHPTSIIDGILLGQAAIEISSAQTGYGQWGTDKHYFYEMSVDLDILRLAGWDGEKFNIHWTQNCGNDSIVVDPPATVPEPNTIVLLGIALMMLFMGQRKSVGKVASLKLAKL